MRDEFYILRFVFSFGDERAEMGLRVILRKFQCKFIVVSRCLRRL